MKEVYMVIMSTEIDNNSMNGDHAVFLYEINLNIIPSVLDRVLSCFPADMERERKLLMPVS